MSVRDPWGAWKPQGLLAAGFAIKNRFDGHTRTSNLARAIKIQTALAAVYSPRDSQ